MINKGI